MTLDLQEVQAQLKAMKLDGWLLYDFQGLNPIARKLLGLQEALLTRRWFCWIPSQGSMTLLCHRIERQGFDRLPASTVLFSSWEEMQAGLERLLQGSRRVAMEYSPHCSIPYVSRVDAGTLELVRALGKTVVSSADLVQYFEARWSQEQLQTHLQASRLLMDVLVRDLRTGAGGHPQPQPAHRAPVATEHVPNVPGAGTGIVFPSHCGRQPEQRKPPL